MSKESGAVLVDRNVLIELLWFAEFFTQSIHDDYALNQRAGQFITEVKSGVRSELTWADWRPGEEPD